MIKKTPDDIPKATLTKKEAAVYLNISELQLSNMTKAGDVPHIRMGKLVRYSVAALDVYLLEASTTEWKDFIPDRKEKIRKTKAEKAKTEAAGGNKTE